ncbi:MAG: P-type conjugative transfer protein TrbG [Sphingopyxis sp.]|nr:P-type conjugative transfer protein TrbG [Sphingopyxis sp.]
MIRILILSASIVSLPCPGFAQPIARVEAANKAALREPSRDGYLHAVQIYPYNDGVVYRLYAAPERVSDIALQPGEALVSVAAGDTVRWTVGDTTSGSGAEKRTHLLVKPFSAGLSTNLVITTDRRVYRVQLTSTAATAMTAIAWTYPQDELLALQRQAQGAEAAQPVSAGIEIEHLSFNYRISGDRPAWLPLRAFDDGRQTWIEFPGSIEVGEAPPLFVLGDKGQAELVNYRVSGRYYIVDRLFGAAELRLGGQKQKVVRITRVEAKPKRRAGRGS